MSALGNEPANLSETERLYGIAELAVEFGVTQRAIRFYESKGLLTPLRVGQNRVYTRRDRARLKLVLRAKSIGFPLGEIQQFLDLYGSRGEGKPKQAAFLAERATALIADLERKQASVTATIEELNDIRAHCLHYLQEKTCSLYKETD